MVSEKECILYDRPCIHCGECDRCDLNPDKICDNCMKCINSSENSDYRSIAIDGILLESQQNKDN